MPPIPFAVIELTFVPIARIGDVSIRLETIGLAVVIFASLVAAQRIARRTRLDASRPPDAPGPAAGERNHLRADDLLFIAIASLPGAVVGGRIGYGLLHLDYYAANPGALFDTAQGGFQLSLAVLGGIVTAAIVTGLLGAPIGRWLHALVLPLLFALAAGKAALILGCDGQGVPFDGGWATSYTGPGPWGSLAPEIPSHPSQAYEALATAGVVLVVTVMLSIGWFRRRDGRVFLAGLALWAGARGLVAFTWRDPATLGPLNTDQLISIAIAIGSLAALALVPVLGAIRSRPTAGGSVDDAMDWPDPATRPRV